MKSVQRLKDAEKELRYAIKYIKVRASAYLLCEKYICWVQRPPRENFFRPQHSTEAAVEESERIFSKLIRSIEKQSCDVKEVIRVQERAAVSQAEEQLEKIQREMVETRRTEAKLEKLCRTEDHVYFLQVCNNSYFRPSCLHQISQPHVTFIFVEIS